MKKAAAIAQALLWLWALGFLAYYYYAHDFLPMLRHYWTQAFG